jgi:hypothetical protein
MAPMGRRTERRGYNINVFAGSEFWWEMRLGSLGRKSERRFDGVEIIWFRLVRVFVNHKCFRL